MRGFVLFTVDALKSGDRLEFVTRDGIEGGISRYSCFGMPFVKLRLQDNRSMGLWSGLDCADHILAPLMLRIPSAKLRFHRRITFPPKPTEVSRRLNWPLSG
jgi:hypothetical protein